MTLAAGPVTSSPLGDLLGRSPAITAVREQVERLLRRQAEGARRLAPILILGETGTGKGLLAGILHRAGSRAGPADSGRHAHAPRDGPAPGTL